MATAKAFVTPEVMRWAREQMGLSLDEAAHKIGRPIQDVEGWENGTLRPSIAQARKASEVYKRPLAVFYLPKQPTDFATLRDFRSLPDSESRRYSPELALLVRTSAFRKQWLSEYLEEEGVEPLPFVASASLLDSSSSIAGQIRNTLDVTQREIKNCSSQYEALRLWIRKAEVSGIFVFRSSKVGVQEARGFSLSDEMAPIILINSKDAKAAQIFTLAHELAHIWLGHNAISNLEQRGQMIDRDAHDIEVFCNQVASETILEPHAFWQAWRKVQREEDRSRTIELLSRAFKVSEEVIARRMLQEGIIAQQEYEQLRDSYQQRWKVESEKAGGGGVPTYYIIIAAQNGHLFTRTVLGGFLSGTISGRDASELLNVKVNNFPKLGETVGLPSRVLS